MKLWLITLLVPLTPCCTIIGELMDVVKIVVLARFVSYSLVFFHRMIVVVRTFNPTTFMIGGSISKR